MKRADVVCDNVNSKCVLRAKTRLCYITRQYVKMDVVVAKHLFKFLKFQIRQRQIVGSSIISSAITESEPGFCNIVIHWYPQICSLISSLDGTKLESMYRICVKGWGGGKKNTCMLSTGFYHYLSQIGNIFPAEF